MKFPNATQIEEALFAVFLVVLIVVGEANAARLTGAMDQAATKTVLVYGE